MYILCTYILSNQIIKIQLRLYQLLVITTLLVEPIELVRFPLTFGFLATLLFGMLLTFAVVDD